MPGMRSQLRTLRLLFQVMGGWVGWEGWVGWVGRCVCMCVCHVRMARTYVRTNVCMTGMHGTCMVRMALRLKEWTRLSRPAQPRCPRVSGRLVIT